MVLWFRYWVRLMPFCCAVLRRIALGALLRLCGYARFRCRLTCSLTVPGSYCCRLPTTVTCCLHSGLIRFGALVLRIHFSRVLPLADYPFCLVLPLRLPLIFCFSSGSVAWRPPSHLRCTPHRFFLCCGYWLDGLRYATFVLRGCCGRGTTGYCRGPAC